MTPAPAIDRLIEGQTRDLGGFSVRRVLPAPFRRTVGPFIFFDEMGPATFPAGDEGIDVRPHPHIGLATVTYLFEGEIIHRDSLGYEQPIRPGDVNWMIAGSGIVHSERTRVETRNTERRIHGIQTWIALPLAEEETDPAFVHHPGNSIPEWSEGGFRLRLIAGDAFGRSAPVKVFVPMFYLFGVAESDASLQLDPSLGERAVFALDDGVMASGQDVPAGTMATFEDGAPATVQARAGARVMMLGGTPVDAPREVWWNFVSSNKDRIEQAKRDWKEGRFSPVPGDDEFIPLPEE